MARKINRERLKAFIFRRKANALGLSMITAFSAGCTVLSALMGFKRTDVLLAVTVLLALLCLVQAVRMKRSFRTMRTVKSVRRRKEKMDA